MIIITVILFTRVLHKVVVLGVLNRMINPPGKGIFFDGIRMIMKNDGFSRGDIQL